MLRNAKHTHTNVHIHTEINDLSQRNPLAAALLKMENGKKKEREREKQQNEYICNI
jgi:hypothetical protein